MRGTRFVTVGLGLAIFLAACGGGGGRTDTPTPNGSGESPSGTPAEALLVIADPDGTHDVLEQALGQASVKKYFLTSRSMNEDSIDGLTFTDQTVWGTVPTAAFAQDADFKAAYEDAYGHPATVFGTAAAYDSVYVAALAAVAANSDDPAAIRGAINFVTNSPGQVTTYGSEAFSAASEELTSGTGADVNYIGASGQVDIDDRGEMAKSSVQTWRVINDTIAPIETRDIDLAAESGAVLPEGSQPLPAPTPDGFFSIGIIVPDSDEGTALSDAAQLAVDEINAAGGVWGGDVTLHIQTLGGPEQAAHAAGLLVTDDGVGAIIGPTTEEATEVMLSTATDANVPVLSLSSDPALSGVEDPNNVLFRFVPSDALQMPVLANLFLEGYATPTPTQGIAPGEGPLPGSVCVVYQDGPAFRQMADAYKTAMDHKKATVRASMSFNPDSADYSALLRDCIGA